MLAVDDYPACQMRNSQFSNNSTYAVRFIRGSAAVLDNNIVATRSTSTLPTVPFALLWPEAIQRMEITHNAFTVEAGAGICTYLGSHDGAQIASPAAFHLSHNIVSGSGGIIRCSQFITQVDSPAMLLQAAELQLLLRKRISWHEAQNLYSTGTPLLSLSSPA